LYRFAEDLVERRLQEYRRAPASQGGSGELPSAADFTFDQPFSGSGWHIRERQADGWYCWMDREATLHLSLEGGGDHTLHCHVAHVASAEAWQGLEVCVNDQPVELSARVACPPTSVVARVPAELLAVVPGRVRLGFRVPQTVCPWERDPANPDRRRLGVALSRVQLLPCAAA
jgi:hypothetical protein